MTGPSAPLPAADQKAFAAALKSGNSIAGVNDGGGVAASDRFRIYRNNVIVSLREALGTTFQTTARLMGNEFFEAAAVAYAEREKPQNPLLFQYGATFADFLAALPGLKTYPFVAEVARIEYARVQAYHAADKAPLAPDALGAVQSERLGEVMFDAHPAATIVSAPAGGVGAWLSNQVPPSPPVEAAAALITRPAMEVVVTPLDAPSKHFAQALFCASPLADAAAGDGLDLAAALGTLLSAGAFCALHLQTA